MPLAALAALRPTLRLACVTLVIVVLIPGSGSGVWPFERPIDRVLEILIGACAALAAAFIVPNRAINTAHQRASDIVMTLGELIAATLKPSGDRTRADQLHRQASSAESALDDAITEAGREHIIVPVKRTRGDIVDKAAPMLKRLHRDALLSGAGVWHGCLAPAACVAGTRYCRRRVRSSVKATGKHARYRPERSGDACQGRP